MRIFNTTGPVKCKDHYCLQPLERFDLAEILFLIDQKKYFVLHAPRQTGKTTCLLALTDYINKQGKYRCLYANVEKGQSAREDVERGIRAVIGEIASRARDFLDDDFPVKHMKEMMELWGGDSALNELLTQWSEKSSKPLVILLDEIDSLIGDTLISVLRQLRSGYDKKPERFPQSVILCGVRDVRDYRIHSEREKTVITGGSAFNIKAKSLRLGDFSEQEVCYLYMCHTEETGRKFETGALDCVWELTQGQPWLVNALGYETCFATKQVSDQSEPVTKEMIEQAGENLILRRETHLDQLVDKLKEDRVRQVITPVLLGEELEKIGEDDIQYLIDLGLLRKTSSGPEIANPIYREIIPRELTVIAQYNFGPKFEPAWYITEDGSLDMDKLLGAFQEFFRENSEHWVERFDYKEAGPQLLLQAFLQRIINTDGRIDREYGLGRGRTDLMVIWRYEKGVQKTVIELKIRYGSLKKIIDEGLKQTAEYMDRCGCAEGHLVVFDRSAKRPWKEKIFCRDETYKGYKIKVWGM
ncbi:MAG: ATP-binding protein [Desulfobacterales bacterium]|nr:ATP-binding protein [Desulfobacterales bacterium]